LAANVVCHFGIQSSGYTKTQIGAPVSPYMLNFMRLKNAPTQTEKLKKEISKMAPIENLKSSIGAIFISWPIMRNILNINF